MFKYIITLMISLLISTQIFAMYKPEVAAHRGAAGYLPEHTLEAKALAYAMKPDYIEQDVVLTKDNVFVVLHDVTLETTTDVATKFKNRVREDGHYYAIDFTLAEIKTLKVSERFDPKTGKAIFPKRFPVNSKIDFTVPTLEEEILLIQGLNKDLGNKIGLYIEIKEPEFHKQNNKDMVALLLPLLKKYNLDKADKESKNTIIQTFDYNSVKQIRALGWKGDLAIIVSDQGQNYIDDKEVHKWLLTEEGIKDAAKYASIYSVYFSNIVIPAKNSKGYDVSSIVELVRNNGMKVHTWTHRIDAIRPPFKTSDAMLSAAFLDVKVDGIFTDFPDVVVEYLEKNNLR